MLVKDMALFQVYGLRIKGSTSALAVLEVLGNWCLASRKVDRPSSRNPRTRGTLSPR